MGALGPRPLGRACLTPKNTPLRHMCYLAEVGHSTSKGVGITSRYAQIGPRWRPAPWGGGVPENKPLPTWVPCRNWSLPLPSSPLSPEGKWGRGEGRNSTLLTQQKPLLSPNTFRQCWASKVYRHRQRTGLSRATGWRRYEWRQQLRRVVFHC